MEELTKVLKTLAVAKRELERRLAQAISSEIVAFQKKYGIGVQGVTVEMLEMKETDSISPAHVVFSCRVRLDLGSLD